MSSEAKSASENIKSKLKVVKVFCDCKQLDVDLQAARVLQLVSVNV